MLYKPSKNVDALQWLVHPFKRKTNNNARQPCVYAKVLIWTQQDFAFPAVYLKNKTQNHYSPSLFKSLFPWKGLT